MGAYGRGHDDAPATGSSNPKREEYWIQRPLY
jgi:hypothetical protein